MSTYPIPAPDDDVWIQMREASKMLGMEVYGTDGRISVVWGVTPRGAILFDRQLKVLLTRPFEEVLDLP